VLGSPHLLQVAGSLTWRHDDVLLDDPSAFVDEGDSWRLNYDLTGDCFNVSDGQYMSVSHAHFFADRICLVLATTTVHRQINRPHPLTKSNNHAVPNE